MYKHFRWIPTLILGFVTCNVYTLYTWFKLSREQNDMAEKLGEKRIVGFLGAFVLGFVTLGIFPIVWMYMYSKQQAIIAADKNVDLTPTQKPVLLWLLTAVPVYSFYVLCTNHNRLAKAFEA